MSRYDRQKRSRSRSRERSYSRSPIRSPERRKRYDYSESSRYSRNARSPERKSTRDRSPSSHSRYRSKVDDTSKFSSRKSLSPPPSFAASRKSRSPSPVTDESTRDARTVFVTQLPPNFTDSQLYDYFSISGRVKSAKIVTDKTTGRSKGVAYVEFYYIESAENAQKLTGDKIDGFCINVQLSETNRLSAIEQATSSVRRVKMTAQTVNTESRILVQNISRSLKEDALRKVFCLFGRINSFHVVPDPNIANQSVAVVAYEGNNEAKKACDNLNEFVLGGMQLCISIIKDSDSSSPSNSDIHNEILSILQTNSYVVNNEKPTIMSSCIQLSNMYDPEEETNPHWEFDIADDIKEECSKLGKVLHLFVQKNKTGDVFVKFQDAKVAQQAIDVFNGRWFGLRQISCRYIPENLYNDMFSY